MRQLANEITSGRRDAEHDDADPEDSATRPAMSSLPTSPAVADWYVAFMR